MAEHTLEHGSTPALGILIEELRRHAPEWADRLAGATSERELREIACRLFDLSQHLIRRVDEQERPSDTLPVRIQDFIAENLQRGPTLKQLAKFLGYSEKYCSALFQAQMGEPFSQYLKRLRLEKARRLLAGTEMSVAGIADLLGFSDQFAFSHFFKKALGCSPKQFRQRARADQRAIRNQDKGGALASRTPASDARTLSHSSRAAVPDINMDRSRFPTVS